MTHVSAGLQIVSELASINIRLFPFAAALAKRGHTTLVADPEHFYQVSDQPADACGHSGMCLDGHASCLPVPSRGVCTGTRAGYRPQACRVSHQFPLL